MMLFLQFISFAQLQSLNLQLAEQYMYSGHQQGFYTVADTKTHLEVLGMNSDCLIADFDDALLVDADVKLLDISESTPKNFFKGLSRMHSLTYLNVSKCRNFSWGDALRELPYELYSLDSLKYLFANSLNITRLLPEIGNLRHIEVLSFHNCRLVDLPAQMFMLTKLRVLDLCYNDFIYLPDVLARLKNLEVLLLEGNPLEQVLPESLAELQKLEILSLQFSPNMEEKDVIASLEIVSKLKNLKVLHLRDSQLEVLPDCISQMASLEQVSLRGNKIDLKKAAITLSQLPRLRLLDVSSCGIKRLPKELAKLSQLEVLYAENISSIASTSSVYNNSFDSFPTELLQSVSLKSIYTYNSQKLTYSLKESEADNSQSFIETMAY